MDSPTVLVTGAGGRLGRAVVPELRAAGWRVAAVDRRPPPDGRVAGVPVLQADLTDPASAARAVGGCAAVVHLAGHPSPYGLPGHEIFANNTRATYHVLEAAGEAGVRNAVIASSTAAYGFTFAPRPVSPRYAPVDEDHPLLTQDPYSLSRVVDEATAATAARRYGMTVVALRFNWVASREEIRRKARAVAHDPEFGRSAPELWGYLEADEAARACRAALAVRGGSHMVNVAAPYTLSETPTERLLARYHPNTPVRTEITGTTGAWSTARAADLLGFAPQWSWRTEPTKEDNPS